MTPSRYTADPNSICVTLTTEDACFLIKLNSEFGRHCCSSAALTVMFGHLGFHCKLSNEKTNIWKCKSPLNVKAKSTPLSQGSCSRLMIFNVDGGVWQL